MTDPIGGISIQPKLVPYVIKEGDNLSTIAEKRGVQLADLENINAKVLNDRDRLVPGQTIMVPERETAVPGAPGSLPPPVNPGGVSLRHGTTSRADDLLAVGQENDPQDVRDMQTALKALGYKVDVTGNYDSKTKAAVWNFQKKHHLAKDGMIGSETRQHLLEAASKVPSTSTGGGSTTTTPPTTTTPATDTRPPATTTTPTPDTRPPATTTPPTTTVPPGTQPPPSTPRTSGPAVAPQPTPDGSQPGGWRPNPAALERARTTETGRRLVERTPMYAEMYGQASRITGVPPELIAAIHCNESGQGTYGPSINGPESGFGLDPRSVTTAYGNTVLREYQAAAAREGISVPMPWQRGQDTPTGRLQSAIIAAEHLRRMAGAIDINVGPNMSAGELAGAITAYAAGTNAGRAALRRGETDQPRLSWMFDRTDPNPHPVHPGGTSIGAHGQTVRVASSRKDGLLRWDTLVPLLREQLQ